MTGYKLVQASPAPDVFRGDVDLFAKHHLSKIAGTVLGGQFKVEDYLNGLPHGKEFRK